MLRFKSVWLVSPLRFLVRLPNDSVILITIHIESLLSRAFFKEIDAHLRFSRHFYPINLKAHNDNTDIFKCITTKLKGIIC